MTEKIENAQQAVEKIFENLNKWRHLPKYQLERRADMFFGLYVKEIVENGLHLQEGALSEIIIPEFPIKKEPETNRSVNVDYALFAKDGKSVYFIELKTDMGSRNEAQDKYLEDAASKENKKNIGSFIDHIQEVADKSKNPKSWKKYQNLLTLIDAPNREAEIKVIYIQPEMPDDKHPLFDGAKCITFSEICKWLENQDGEFPVLFAKYLCKWGKEKAGDTKLTHGS